MNKSLVCVNASILRMNRFLICGNGSILCMNRSLVYVNGFILCTTRSLVFVNGSILCVKRSLVCVAGSVSCVNVFLLCVDRSLWCVNGSLLYIHRSLLCRNGSLSRDNRVKYFSKVSAITMFSEVNLVTSSLLKKWYLLQPQVRVRHWKKISKVLPRKCTFEEMPRKRPFAKCMNMCIDPRLFGV